jgi:hypothetical protein
LCAFSDALANQVDFSARESGSIDATIDVIGWKLVERYILAIILLLYCYVAAA